MPLRPDPTAYYRLTNTYTGPSAPLSVYRDPTTTLIYLTTATPSNPSTEKQPLTTTPYWQFFPVHGSSPPQYHILTEYRPTPDAPAQFLALDILNEDKTVPHLTQPGYYSGQYWTLSGWTEDSDGMGDMMLKNDYSGDGLQLDTYSGSMRGFMGSGNCTGQHWVIERVEKPVVVREGVSGLKERDWGSDVGGFGFGIGFGTAVVVALFSGEFLPLLLVGGLGLMVGVKVGRGTRVRI